MKEKEIIEAVRKHLGRPGFQLNEVFTSDAEIVKIGEGAMAFTIDEFSREDGLYASDPKLLGRNVAIATFSDLLAVLAEPMLMMTSLIVPHEADTDWVSAFSLGISDVLRESGASYIGGDVGCDKEYRVTGFAAGILADPDARASRLIRPESGAVMVTGSFGDGTLAFLSGDRNPFFESRLEESRRLAGIDVALIDTSDGIFSALETVARLNDSYRFEIDISVVPCADGVLEMAGKMDIRPEAFLMSSAGEYELVAFVGEEHAGKIGSSDMFRRIGRFERRGAAGIVYRTADGRTLPHETLPDPRACVDLDNYRKKLISMSTRMFG